MLNLSQRSPAPVSGSGVADAAAFLALIVVTFPNICNKITHPIYATENNNMVFGLIYHPSASSPKNERPSFGFIAFVFNDLRPELLARSCYIFLASSLLSSDITFFTKF